MNSRSMLKDGLLEEFLGKLKKYDLKPIVTDEPEETAEDINIASEEFRGQDSSYISIPIDVANLKPSDVEIHFKYFIDGVVETYPIAMLNIKGIAVPIHLCVCGAGAFIRREFGGEVEPTENTLFISFVALPYSAIRDLDPGFPQFPGVELTKSKPILDHLNLEKNRYDIIGMVDTSLRFHDGSRAIEKEDLVRTGYIRRRVTDLARVLMRIMEIGVLYKLKKSKYDGLIALDGPIAPLLIYSKAVSSEIEGLYNIENKPLSYRMLKHVVGCVKRVYKIPRHGINEVLNYDGSNIVFSVHQMRNVVTAFTKDVDEEDIFKATLSAFAVIRPELRYAYYLYNPISNMSMISRYDIPLPNIADENDEWYLDEYVNSFFKDLVHSPNNHRVKRLIEILKAIVLERFPVPGAYGYRVFTELYPIYEAEIILRAQLKHLKNHIMEQHISMVYK